MDQQGTGMAKNAGGLVPFHFHYMDNSRGLGLFAQCYTFIFDRNNPHLFVAEIACVLKRIPRKIRIFLRPYLSYTQINHILRIAIATKVLLT